MISARYVNDIAPDADSQTVQGLWIGERLGTMEYLAIASFLRCGHAFHLYCYDGVANVPPGATLKDAHDILPRSLVFRHRSGFGQGSPSGFSNFFRYTLLHKRGGWWSDLDVVCLKYFRFPDERVMAQEKVDAPTDYMVGSAVMKMPPGDPLMAWLCTECQKKDLPSLPFGQIGPDLIELGMDALDYRSYVRPYSYFCPVPYYDWKRLIDPAAEIRMNCSYAVHLWNAMWTDAGIDKEARFPARCLYERLKRQYL